MHFTLTILTLLSTLSLSNALATPRAHSKRMTWRSGHAVPYVQPDKRDLRPNWGLSATSHSTKAKRDFGSFDTSRNHMALTKRVDSNAEDLHPLVRRQQEINRATRRHFKFTKREFTEEHVNVQRRHLEERVQSIQKRGELVRRSQINTRDRGHGRGRKAAAKQNADTADATAGADTAAETTAEATAKTTSTDNSTSTSTETETGAGNVAVADIAKSLEINLKANQAGTVTPPNDPTADNTIGLDLEGGNIGYFGDVTVGTPGTKFGILMDSGSSDFWVPGANCATCGKHAAISTDVSSTLKESTTQFQVTYGSGAVEGVLIQDDVNVAGLNLTGHTFGATTAESQQFGDDAIPFDGLMGLAQSTLSNQGVLTPIEALAKAGTVQKAQMGFRLARLADGNQNSQVTFGGIDSTAFSGSLVEFANVNPNGFWEGDVDAFKFAGKDIGLTGRTAILDTGTSLILAPTADAEAVHAAIPGAQSLGQGAFSIPCDTTDSLSLTFAGTEFAIDPRDLVVQPIDNAGTNCLSAISAGQIGGAEQWLVGDTFLVSTYFATSVETNTMALAPLA